MKKLYFLFFIAALAIGSILAVNFNSVEFFNFKSMSSIQGSGNAKQETRNLAGFNEIEAGGAVNTEITVGQDFSVIVETDDNLLQNIKTDISGDTLKIYSEGRISPKTKINIKISMPTLTKIDLSGVSTAIATNLKGDSLELKASGAARIKIDGETKDLSAEASGASKIIAENLKTENADVDASGASTITVSPSGDLKADASGASSVYYTGEPKNIEKDSSGASSVKKK
ncbi:MAG: head GIN domain-containing protein [Pyrinomonadaceae bacterium]